MKIVVFFIIILVHLPLLASERDGRFFRIELMEQYTKERPKLLKALKAYDENKEAYFSSLWLYFSAIEYSDGEYSILVAEDLFDNFEFIYPELLEWFCCGDKADRLIDSVEYSGFAIKNKYRREHIVARLQKIISLLEQQKNISYSAEKLRNRLVQALHSVTQDLEGPS